MATLKEEEFKMDSGAWEMDGKDHAKSASEDDFDEKNYIGNLDTRSEDYYEESQTPVPDETNLEIIPEEPEENLSWPSLKPIAEEESNNDSGVSLAGPAVAAAVPSSDSDFEDEDEDDGDGTAEPIQASLVLQIVSTDSGGNASVRVREREKRLENSLVKSNRDTFERTALKYLYILLL